VDVEGWALALAGSPWAFAVMYLFATIDGFFPPIPSESVVIAFATLWGSSGTPNLPLLLLAAAAGAFTGDQIAYTIGSRVPVRRLRIMRSQRAQHSLDWAEQALAHRGASFIIAARYIPVGRVAVNMSAGALGFPRRRFVLLTGIAAVMWAGYSAAIGLSVGAVLQEYPLVAIAVGVVGGLIIGVVVDWALRRWLARRGAPVEPSQPAERTGEPTPTPAAGA
jgi:membrane protein DedA with SNARE-associated domain